MMDECGEVGVSVNMGDWVVGCGSEMLRMKWVLWVSHRDKDEYECRGIMCTLK